MVAQGVEHPGGLPVADDVADQKLGSNGQGATSLGREPEDHSTSLSGHKSARIAGIGDTEV